MKNSAETLLASYVEALRPIIYINHFDSLVVDDLIGSIDKNAKIIEFNNALGIIDFEDKHPMLACDLEGFLRSSWDEGYNQDTFLVLKDIHEELSNPKIIALLKQIAEKTVSTPGYMCTVFIVAAKRVIPVELENYITIFDFPLPEYEEIVSIITRHAKNLTIDISDDVVGELAISFKGLNQFQIQQILNLAYQDGGTIDKDDKTLILREKEQLVKKSSMLEMINFKETIDDIGGLELLKEWLGQKAEIFRDLDRAVKFGVDVPNGVLIFGMPGCGKSLTAKATASLFEIPLVRLDVGRLLGKYVGESEENMRKALMLAEAISPCVLWIDEIEKAFSGVGGNGGGSDITTRLFGQFLTWMQEKENTVFIVATANNISSIPTEFMRKGRFDELFFVALPTKAERSKILEIHLKKRHKYSRGLITNELLENTKGFNGADLEAVVKEAVEIAFINNKDALTTEDLLNVVKNTKSISQTSKDKIDEIRKKADEMDIQHASIKDPSEKEAEKNEEAQHG